MPIVNGVRISMAEYVRLRKRAKADAEAAAMVVEDTPRSTRAAPRKNKKAAEAAILRATGAKVEVDPAPEQETNDESE